MKFCSLLFIKNFFYNASSDKNIYTFLELIDIRHARMSI